MDCPGGTRPSGQWLSGSEGLPHFGPVCTSSPTAASDWELSVGKPGGMVATATDVAATLYVAARTALTMDLLSVSSEIGRTGLTFAVSTGSTSKLAPIIASWSTASVLGCLVQRQFSTSSQAERRASSSSTWPASSAIWAVESSEAVSRASSISTCPVSLRSCSFFLASPKLKTFSTWSSFSLTSCRSSSRCQTESFTMVRSRRRPLTNIASRFNSASTCVPLKEP
mmetsp:Transcript_41959/g.78469  ORF Transcript_41959/g.78469 Transcript_41959/m.78469 type:complete len:226 (-) Transcript_41959:421-1098(-)